MNVGLLLFVALQIRDTSYWDSTPTGSEILFGLVISGLLYLILKKQDEEKR